MLKKFRTRSEDQVQRHIRAATERHGAEIQEKVRVADIIEIAQLDLPDLGTYALQSHFDFVIIDERQTPLVAIELDGPGHDPVDDAKKDPVCPREHLTLARLKGFEQDQVMNQDRTSVLNSCTDLEDLRDDPE